MDNLSEIWNELDLGGLLKNPQVINKKTNNGQQVDPLLKHDNKWMKPNYSVLKNRYNSLPTEPKFIQKKSLDRLADPLRGKFSNYDKILGNDFRNEENVNSNSVNRINQDVKQSKTSGFFLTGDDEGADSAGENADIDIYYNHKSPHVQAVPAPLSSMRPVDNNLKIQQRSSSLVASKLKKTIRVDKKINENISANNKSVALTHANANDKGIREEAVKLRQAKVRPLKSKSKVGLKVALISAGRDRERIAKVKSSGYNTVLTQQASSSSLGGNASVNDKARKRSQLLSKVRDRTSLKASVLQTKQPIGGENISSNKKDINNNISNKSIRRGMSRSPSPSLPVSKPLNKNTSYNKININKIPSSNCKMETIEESVNADTMPGANDMNKNTQNPQNPNIINSNINISSNKQQQQLVKLPPVVMPNRNKGASRSAPSLGLLEGIERVPVSVPVANASANPNPNPGAYYSSSSARSRDRRPRGLLPVPVPGASTVTVHNINIINTAEDISINNKDDSITNLNISISKSSPKNFSSSKVSSNGINSTCTNANASSSSVLARQFLANNPPQYKSTDELMEVLKKVQEGGVSSDNSINNNTKAYGGTSTSTVSISGNNNASVNANALLISQLAEHVKRVGTNLAAAEAYSSGYKDLASVDMFGYSKLNLE